jgi:hypothetical protein
MVWTLIQHIVRFLFNISFWKFRVEGFVIYLYCHTYSDSRSRHLCSKTKRADQIFFMQFDWNVLSYFSLFHLSHLSFLLKVDLVPPGSIEGVDNDDYLDGFTDYDDSDSFFHFYSGPNYVVALRFVFVVQMTITLP